MASASFDLGLSASFVKSSVSSGSTSLRRKSLPLLMRNGSERSRTLLMISFVLIKFSLVHTEYWRLIYLFTTGGRRYNAVANNKYTMIAIAPTNQVDRPEVVTSEAVSVANRIIATAPGHKFKSIGVGPMK